MLRLVVAKLAIKCAALAHDRANGMGMAGSLAIPTHAMSELITKRLKQYHYAIGFAPHALTSVVSNDQDQSRIEQVGGWFVDPNAITNGPVHSLTPLHGRSAVHVDEQGQFTTIKGLGWTHGGPPILLSPKDAELCFGLFNETDAVRELQVSRWLEQHGFRAVKVTGYASLDIATLPMPEQLQGEGFLYANGAEIKPVLMYVQVQNPLRVADLAFLTPDDKQLAIKEAAQIGDWPEEQFVEAFFIQLIKTVGDLHRAGGVNDTLSPDNITLAAELIDFEWLTVPGIPLPDGTTTENLAVRQQKELLYAIDIGLNLAWHTGNKMGFGDFAGLLEMHYGLVSDAVAPMFEQLGL
jgi:hypothetical protein